nr:complex I NDUFA9 subunit family protein [candidate division Zixibacteria bacterium]
MRIAITGATGFVGRHLVAALRQTGHELRLLVHRREGTSEEDKKIEYCRADVHDLDSLMAAFEKVDIIYHLVGIIAETRQLTFERTVAGGTSNVAAAARVNGTKKIIYLSAAGTSSTTISKYYQSKWAAEESIRNSDLEYTIFRPSVIFGEGDGFINTLIKSIRKSPLVPVIGDGYYRIQPVYIDDLTTIMVAAGKISKFSGETIEIGGPEILEYREILSILKKLLNTKKRNIYLPMRLMKLMAAVLEKVLKPAPITIDQLRMLEMGNICDNRRLYELFGNQLTGFEEGLKKYMGN